MSSVSCAELYGSTGKLTWPTVYLELWSTRESFAARVRSALSAAGYRGKDYAGHSFRIRAATISSRCGMQDSLIKTLGRWESTAYTRYIRTAPEVLCEVSKPCYKVWYLAADVYIITMVESIVAVVNVTVVEYKSGCFHH